MGLEPLLTDLTLPGLRILPKLTQFSFFSDGVKKKSDKAKRTDIRRFRKESYFKSKIGLVFEAKSRKRKDSKIYISKVLRILLSQRSAFKATESTISYIEVVPKSPKSSTFRGAIA